MDSEAYEKVDVLQSEIEAQLLESILSERGVPHRMTSYHDTAYDGLFQALKGWGHVSSPPSRSEEIRTILSEIRRGAD